MKNGINLFGLLVLFACLVSLINICASENVKKSIDDRDDTGETSDETKDESLDIPVEMEAHNNLTCTRKVNSQMHEIRNAAPGQFPFVVALMSHQHEYLCAGSVISNGLILTTAHCTLLPISYVLFNTTRDKKDDGAVMVHVIKTEKFPTYSGTDSLKDVGLVYTAKHNSDIASKIILSNYTSAHDLVDVEAIGFGLNTDVGKPKELQYIGIELRSTIIASDSLKGYFDCIDTKVSTCFRDSSGPVIFGNELVGIVMKGQEECTKEISSTYAINKKIAEILPTYIFKAWLDEKITTNEAETAVELSQFPANPGLRQNVKLASAGAGIIQASVIILIFSIIIFMAII